MSRFVLEEKGLASDIHDIKPDNIPDDLMEINPYGTVPTLVDRDLVLYESRVIMEYLEERFPYPPLLPVDPVSRSRSRLYIYRIYHDWLSLLPKIKNGDEKTQKAARQSLTDSLAVTSPIFESKPYFMSNDFTLVDCVIAPLLWRLPQLGIELPEQATHIHKYAARLFKRDAFKASLTETETEMRKL